MTTTAPEAPSKVDCPRCGAPLRPDQDWCLNCGTAVTTEVAGAPGWRTPVAIVAVVLLLAAAALVFAFLQISDDAERQAQAPPATPTAQGAPTVTPAPTTTPEPTASASPVPTPPATAPTPAATPPPGTSPTPAPAPGGGTIATWPAGREAWSVILFSTTTRREADAKAKGYADQGKSAGVLHSDDFSSLRPGYWVVFSGQYDSQDEAQSAAEGFGDVAPGAYARKVTPK